MGACECVSTTNNPFGEDALPEQPCLTVIKNFERK